MQRSAGCRGLKWFKISSARTVHKKNSSLLHTSFPSKCEPQVQPSSSGAQELSDGGGEENYQHIVQLRQINCWKLWQIRGLSIEEISCILRMQHDTIINIIISIETKRQDVDWLRLCKLLSFTTLAAQTILAARLKAKEESSSSFGAALFLVPEIKKFYPENVKPSHILLVHAMLGRKFTPSEILELTRSANSDHEGTCKMDVTDLGVQLENDAYGLVNIVNSTKTGRNIPNLEHDIEHGNGQESVKKVMSISEAGEDDKSLHSIVPLHKEYKVSSLDAEGQEMEVLTDYPISVAVLGKRSLLTSDILRWIRKNDMVTIYSLVNEFRYCEAKHLLFLLLTMLESSIIVEQDGILRISSEKSSHMLEKPANSLLGLSALPVRRRMHRALCMRAVILNVAMHEPRSDVEFTIRHLKPTDVSTVYRVHICEHPSCTCPDFGMRLQGGLDYMPCKHLIYVYLVQLHLEKAHEHLMLQERLEEEDLEGILEGYY